jgi:hypothetical protein
VMDTLRVNAETFNPRTTDKIKQRKRIDGQK